MPLRVLCGSFGPGSDRCVMLPAMVAGGGGPAAMQFVQMIAQADRRQGQGVSRRGSGASADGRPRPRLHDSCSRPSSQSSVQTGKSPCLDALADRGDVAARPAVLELLASSPTRTCARRRSERWAGWANRRICRCSSRPLADRISEPNGRGPAEPDANRGRIDQQSAGGRIASAGAQDQGRADRGARRRGAPPMSCPRHRGGDAWTTMRTSVERPWRRWARSAVPSRSPQMLPGVLKARKGSERDDAEKNVALVCERIENEDERGTTS